MSNKEKQDVLDRLEFQFAGSPHKGRITEIDRGGKEIKYTCKDSNGFFYPFTQEDVIKKL